MCLLLTSTSANLRTVLLDTDGLIEDVYANNSDGLGIMYHTKSGIKVVKLLPQSASVARAAVASLPNDDRQVAMHWRMRTHGNIDKENCHPYPIGHGAWLMHNGILHTGNKADPSKSDTWHFAKDYLSTLDADTLHNPQVLKLLGEFIQNNRFVIATADGRMSWVNADQGVQSHGITFSNTYAWTPSLLIPEYRQRQQMRSGWMYPTGKFGQLEGLRDDYDDYAADLGELDYETACEMVAEVLTTYDEAALIEMLREDFENTCDAILDNYAIEESVHYRADDHTPPVNQAVKAWVAGSFRSLRTMRPEPLAQALLYCCDVTETGSPSASDMDAYDDTVFARIREAV